MSTVTVSRPSATTWTIDPTHTTVEFSVRHLMIATVKGRFTGVSGSVTIDTDDRSNSQVDISIDAASIDTREPQRDAHLRSADFFEIEKYPTLTFRSRRLEGAGDDFKLIGDLTIRGVTREVALEVTSEGRVRDPWGKERAGFSATARIKRSDFGLTWNQALETGGVLVSDEVKISLDVEIVQG